MLEIRVDNQPTKFLSKCDKILYERIVAKLRELKENPVPHDAKKVIGYKEPTFRIRVGKYRILYRIDYSLNFVVVVKIDHREKVY